jgi:hypothetical protein
MSKRVLDPIDRVSEVLFGLIMVLTFTGSLSVAESGREDVRAMLIGALGCNIAWGIIDAMLYLMGCLAEKGRGLITLRAVRKAVDPREAQRHIADALPPVWRSWAGGLEKIYTGDRTARTAGSARLSKTICWARWACSSWCFLNRWRYRSWSCEVGRACVCQCDRHRDVVLLGTFGLTGRQAWLLVAMVAIGSIGTMIGG